jgi:hypothetical protein
MDARHAHRGAQCGRGRRAHARGTLTFQLNLEQLRKQAKERVLRVAAGTGDLHLIRELAGTPRTGAHREFYRPHGGFPAWQPSDDAQEVLDEGADPLIRDTLHGGSALGWAKVGGHEELADVSPDRRGIS